MICEEKIDEAEYFLDMIESLKSPHTARTLDAEATYLTSGLMNVCYSVTEQIVKEVKDNYRDKLQITKRHVNRFLRSHPHVKRTRGVSVHQRPIPAKQMRGSGAFGASMFGASMFGAGPDLGFFFTDDQGKEHHVVETFKKCLFDLKQLKMEIESTILEPNSNG